MQPRKSATIAQRIKSTSWILQGQGEFCTATYQNRTKCNARDTFTGAYASEYLRQKEAGKWNIKSAVDRANRAAALTITKLGAQQGIPWADEVDRFDAPINDPDISTLTISQNLGDNVRDKIWD